MSIGMELAWVEISKSALIHNLKTFRGIVGKSVALAPVLKANAYGHGIKECSGIFEENGADYLCVNAPFEAEILRKNGIKIPILIIGYTPFSALEDTVFLGNTELTVYNLETVEKLGRIKIPSDFRKINAGIKIHLKIETGNYRQGVLLKDIPGFIKLIRKYPHINFCGVSTHFANLEDRINQQYAIHQMKEFKKAVHLLEAEGMAPRFRHAANTAAAILLPSARFNFVRVGIGMYGLWPSGKTELAAAHAGINIKLKPAMSWKTIIIQIKNVKKGSFIGYGCTYKMPYDGRIAVIPVGYYDGFVRLFGNRGHVLIRGKKCPIVGRVCMNMAMADVTRLDNLKPEEEVVLLGRQGSELITAEELGGLSDTINYEVTTRINERIPRILKN